MVPCCSKRISGVCGPLEKGRGNLSDVCWAQEGHEEEGQGGVSAQVPTSVTWSRLEPSAWPRPAGSLSGFPGDALY